MFLVGVTGGIASGKSTVAKMLGKYENEIIDADEIAREVVTRGSEGLQKVVVEFGPQVLLEDGTLDRAELAEMIFADPNKRSTLEGILHPLIKARAMQRIMQSQSEIVFYVVPLLVEAKVDYPFDFVVTIETGTKNQIKRLVENRGMSVEDATSRITAQATEAERVAKADLRINGSMDLADLEVVVANLWKQVQLMATEKADHGEN